MCQPCCCPKYVLLLQHPDLPMVPLEGIVSNELRHSSLTYAIRSSLHSVLEVKMVLTDDISNSF